jgi:hypothetical protein
MKASKIRIRTVANLGTGRIQFNRGGSRYLVPERHRRKPSMIVFDFDFDDWLAITMTRMNVILYNRPYYSNIILSAAESKLYLLSIKTE